MRKRPLPLDQIGMSAVDSCGDSGGDWREEISLPQVSLPLQEGTAFIEVGRSYTSERDVGSRAPLDVPKGLFITKVGASATCCSLLEDPKGLFITKVGASATCFRAASIRAGDFLSRFRKGSAGCFVIRSEKSS